MKRNDITDYLRKIASLCPGQPKFKEYYDWILANGETFTNKVKARRLGKKKACYYNAQMDALDDPDIEYYEGYGITNFIGLPFEHGFNVKNGKVIDPTWEDGKLYFGVKIPKDFYRRIMLDTKIAGTVLQQYWIECTKKEREE